ncbi:lipocalin family protein [Shewanella fidelis]|uniref:Outer membrane lipoprotein Blc n=1 Tax=Shewanella fidelis TaxID=173509 RepID=A0AAW8NHJ4_9GAMM|nr:lipocalin family protein [Shewanella fidelis]MDR8522628.1 lipocalin family protein [Shewanella fidelis]MDW4812244.1 lipocalin family protein [Shewanella fidelis]MDW4816092.1 lipocalin family protein [Shewanella fidelis]MDW4820485.1 lipocalin family protein [Shewanella fidelis]MDW4824707.1 lipocalin family protein [Shewanella fidelis]
MRLITIACLLLLSACTSLPSGIEPVKGFELPRYLGTWYEVARLDHSFERGLNQVTATYSMRDDGGVKVVNRGFSVAEQAWDEAEGKAYFVDSPDIGHLKVSFFGPFYGAYVVYELDNQDYQYAFITSYNREYLWFLSRTPTVDDTLKQQFIEQAKKLGFATEQIIWVAQS